MCLFWKALEHTLLKFSNSFYSRHTFTTLGTIDSYMCCPRLCRSPNFRGSGYSVLCPHAHRPVHPLALPSYPHSAAAAHGALYHHAVRPLCSGTLYCQTPYATVRLFKNDAHLWKPFPLLHVLHPAEEKALSKVQKFHKRSSWIYVQTQCSS